MAGNSKDSGDSGWIGSAITGAALFAGILIFLGSMPLAVAGGVAGLVAGSLIFKSRPRIDRSLLSQGITQEMLDEALREGALKVGALKQVGMRISSPVVQFKVKQIVEIAQKILEDVRKDPIDLKAARPFLNYYLDTTIRILESYAALSAKKVLDPDVMRSLKRVEALLDQIRLAFHKQLAKLMENEVLDLDTEMQVLQKSIELDYGSMQGQSKPMA